jgi:predicted nucleic acid-binding protein
LATLIDTNIAIHLRDGDATIVGHIDALPAPPSISVISRVELEGGVHVKPAFAAKRRAALDILLGTIMVIPFDAPMAEAYGRIVAACGFSRTRILDRMIAATALVQELTLITINGDDFRDVPGLKLEVW